VPQGHEVGRNDYCTCDCFAEAGCDDEGVRGGAADSEVGGGPHDAHGRLAEVELALVTLASRRGDPKTALPAIVRFLRQFP
jgi:hypothetical protein